MSNTSTGQQLRLATAIACLTLSAAVSADSWQAPSGKEYHALVAGNTVSHTGGNWSVYYAPDGRKLVRIRADTTERKWWLSADGKWCETAYRDAAEICADPVDLQVNGAGIRKTNSYGGAEWTAEVRAGNPLDL